jgi:gliding motility-associated-like protein
MDASSNANKINWYPTTGINTIGQLNTFASPTTTTKYYITAITGVCTQKDSMMIYVNPAPIPDAGVDTVICYGTNVQLQGSGGKSFSWSPTIFLDDPKSPAPTVIKPLASISYHLMVTDEKGCRSLQPSTVTVNVTPPTQVYIGKDTVLAVGEPLPLVAKDVNKSGFVFYNWTPNYMISDVTIVNPVVTPDHDIIYKVNAKTDHGCEGEGTIKIKVYVGPEIYVPTAFTPNGDKLNDLLKAIPVGMKQFNYFVIFNRWGQKVFYTTDPSNGWDGKIDNHDQGSNVYIWIAEAVDYKGRVIQKKGTVTLIR